MKGKVSRKSSNARSSVVRTSTGQVTSFGCCQVPLRCWKSLLFLVRCLVLAQRSMPQCQLPGAPVSGVYEEGDIVIGGIFPVHMQKVYPETTFRAAPAPISCQKFGLQNYQWLQAMVFAIAEINGNPDLLPNITLGFEIYDCCFALQLALEGTLRILTGQKHSVANYRCPNQPPLAGIVGDAGSTRSILMAQILGLYRLPQISYFATSPLLSNRRQFPSFFRTIPSDDFQSSGLAQLLLHFGWTWVGLLAEDSDYGQQGIQILKQELYLAGACVAFSENIVLSRADRNAFHIVQVIKKSTASAVVIFSLDSEMVPIIEEIMRQNVTGKIWIASESWSTSSFLSDKKYSAFLTGTIGFTIHSGKMPGFEDFLISVLPLKFPDDVLLRGFWKEAFDCQWLDQKDNIGAWNNQTRLCTGAEKLNSVLTDYTDVTSLRVTYNVYTAVYSIALALHNLLSCRTGEGPFHQGSCAEVHFEPWQVLSYVHNVHFETALGDPVHFDMSGNPLAQYDIINWQMNEEGTITHVKVGSYDSSAAEGESLLINARGIVWPTKSRQVPVSVCSPSCLPGFWKAAVERKPICCFQCLPCPPGEISNLTDAVECTSCPWDHWPNDNHDGCIPKNMEFLAYNDHLGITLAATNILFSIIPISILGLFIHHRNTPIVKANNRSVSYLLLMSLNVCFLCSLIFIGYPTPEKCILRQATFGITFSVCVSCILAKTITVVIAFNATKPNSKLRRWVGPKLSYMIIAVCSVFQVILCISWLMISPPFLQNNTHSHPGIIIVECNEGSPFAFWCMLGYLVLLAIISFIVAFLARQLPDTFNEAKFITFSILAFLIVWISFIPAYLSTKGKYMVAMEIFAILTSSLSLVSCIFFPKCYIILLRPELNTKGHLIERG